MKICVWEKKTGKYKTTCGHAPSRLGRGWMYCPFCGSNLNISVDRSEYQKKYYQAHKKLHSEYYKEYYKEHR